MSGAVKINDGKRTKVLGGRYSYNSLDSSDINCVCGEKAIMNEID